MGLTIIPSLPGLSRKVIDEAKERRNREKGYSREGTHIGHTPNGWPHVSAATGACMCLDRCCLREGGCVCRYCSGRGHTNCKRADSGQSRKRRLRVA